jgi:hypothetical protein
MFSHPRLIDSRQISRRAFGRSAVVGALGAGLLLAACALPAQQHQAVPVSAPGVSGPPVAVSPPTITINAHDYAFVAPETIEGGLVTIAFKNLGQEPHHAQLLRLKDGVTFDQFTQALQQGEEAVFPLITAEGGPSVVGHGGAAEVTLNLRPGDYVMACFIPSPDGVPHLAKGMLRPMRVAAAKMTIAAPETRGAVSMVDFGYTMPKTLPAGRSTLRVVNDGRQFHEVSVLRLAPGKTLDDAKGFFNAPAGPPPFEPIGGMQGLDPGGSGYMTLDLQPGQYVAVCHIPDLASGKSHLDLGMIAGFTVQ